MNKPDVKAKMRKLVICIIFSIIISQNEAVNIEIGKECETELADQTSVCERTINLACLEEEEKSEIKFTTGALYSGGVFEGDKFTVRLKLKCSSSQTGAFHEIAIQNITFPNTASTVQIGNGNNYDQDKFYDFVNGDLPIQFTESDAFWIIMINVISEDLQIPNIILHTTSVPHKIVSSNADMSGIEATDLKRNSDYTWIFPNPSMNGEYRYLTATFPLINLTTTQGDMLLVSDGEPFQSETFVLPYKAENLTLQIRNENAKINLQVGRHTLPVEIGFIATFEVEEPILTTTRAPATTTTKAPSTLDYIRIIVIGWKSSEQANNDVFEDVKSQLNDILNCHRETTENYQIYLLNQTTCLRSWTVPFEECTQVLTGTSNFTKQEYHQALSDESCRAQYDKYTIRFPEEMFDFYNMVAIPIAAVSLAIIVVAILAIWRGSLAYYYSRQLKVKNRQYSATPSGDNKDDPWGKGKDGHYNEAFEPVEDDDDVIFDPTIDGSVYSRYSSISTTTGPSSMGGDDEPASATYTTGRLPRGRRIGSTDGPITYKTLPQVKAVQHLQLQRISNASTVVSSTNF